MANPTFVAKGAWAAGTTSFSPGIPAGMAAGDFMILDVHTCNQAVTTPSGWTIVTGSPISTGTANTAGGTRLTQYYRWWQSGDAAPSVAVTGGTVSNGIISGYRNVDPTTPFDATPTSNIVTPASTTLTWAAITTATAGARIHLAAARDQDLNNTAAVASYTNANLTGLTEIHDQVVNTGVGGGIANAYGSKATASSTGTTTATQTSSIACCMTIALRPKPPVTHATTGVLVGANSGVVGSAKHNVPHASTGVLLAGDAKVVGSAARSIPSPIIQDAYNVDDSGLGGSTIAASLTGVTAGNALVVFVAYEGSSIATTVSDGTAYTESASGECFANSQSSRVFYLPNSSSGNKTITATFTGSPSYRRIRVFEVSGLASSGIEDQSANQGQVGPGTTTDAISSSATATTTQADCLVLGLSQNSSEADPGTGTLTAGTGYTIIGTNLILGAEYKEVSATGAQTATFTQSVNNSHTTHVIAFKKASGPVTHATTGVLTGSASALAGTAAHIAIHGTTGALTGSGSSLSGSAARFRAHATTGVLAAGEASIVGTAARSTGVVTHATTGALVGANSTVVGAATRFRAHGDTGAITGAGSSMAGAATRFRAHATTGILATSGTAVAGTANRFRAHASTGVLSGDGAVVVGSARLNIPHGTTGVLAGPGAQVAGTASHSATAVTHDTSGILVGAAANAIGAANRFRAFGTVGVLVGAGSALPGAAARTRVHATDGALLGLSSALEGSSSRTRVHGTSGVLLGTASEVTGFASRFRVHTSTGALLGKDSVLTGYSARGSAGAAVWPLPNQVLAGVTYGPNGIDYTGTLQVPKVLFDLTTGQEILVLNSTTAVLL